MMNPSTSNEGNESYDIEANNHLGGFLDDLWSGYRHIEKVSSLSPLPDDFISFSELMALSDAQFDTISRIDKHFDEQSSLFRAERRNLSTEVVVRVAAAHFVQLSSLVAGDPSKIGLPFGLSLSSLTSEEVKNVELVSLLLAAAEKVSNQQYDRAEKLLTQCYLLSHKTGDPIQRVVYHFTNALQERVDRETGVLLWKKAKELETIAPQDVIKAMLTNHEVHIVANKELPFTQALEFTSIQAILDTMVSAKRIHVVDLSIKHGLHWAVLMQALATRQECPIDSLKISAVATNRDAITAIGNRLSSFAKSLSLPFEFRVVIAPDMKDLREDMFDLEEGEAVAVYSELVMNSLLVKPESLENLMRVILRLNPRLMATVDVEAKLNSRSFINRFTEALFFYSVYFDCLDSLMKSSDKSRMMIEEGFFSQAIKSILADEGSERVVRQVGASVWRAFFARFGFVEMELSKRSLYQARLIVQQFVKDGSCTLEMNGNSLLVGWKGTPLHFVSAWKLQRNEGFQPS